MIKILDEVEAKEVWNNYILQLPNQIYYQSFDYAMAYKKDGMVKFAYDFEKKIYGFIKISENEITIPFGPITGKNVSVREIVSFVDEISSLFQKSVVFSITNELIEETNILYPNFEKVWLFKTPILDTTVSIDELVRNCTENRRRIIRKGLQNIPSEMIRSGIEYLDDFCKLYEKRMTETNGEIDFTRDDLENYLNQPTSDLIVCLYDNKVIASHLIFAFGNTVSTRYNCFDSKYAKISPAARIDFEIIRRCCENPNIENYDMSGLAYGENISQKLQSINRYKESYNPTKINTYQWYRARK